jgi:hypothetical protein
VDRTIIKKRAKLPGNNWWMRTHRVLIHMTPNFHTEKSPDLKILCNLPNRLVWNPQLLVLGDKDPWIAKCDFLQT